MWWMVSDQTNKQVHYMKTCSPWTLKERSPEAIFEYFTSNCDVRLWGYNGGNVVNGVRSNKQTKKCVHYMKTTVNVLSRRDFPKPFSDISPASCDVIGFEATTVAMWWMASATSTCVILTPPNLKVQHARTLLRTWLFSQREQFLPTPVTVWPLQSKQLNIYLRSLNLKKNTAIIDPVISTAV